MNTKTLNALQVLAKIGRILSTIVFVFSIVGAALCALGILSLALIPNGIKIGGTNIQGIVAQKAGWSMPTCYLAMTQGVILCAGEAVLAKFAERYLKNELAAGTPFTFDGAKELLRLGILAICIPIGTSILAAIAYGIFKAVAKDAADPDFEYSTSIILGVMMTVGSLLCKHGAEVSEKPAEQTAE